MNAPRSHRLFLILGLLTWGSHDGFLWFLREFVQKWRGCANSPSPSLYQWTSGVAGGSCCSASHGCPHLRRTCISYSLLAGFNHVSCSPLLGIFSRKWLSYTAPPVGFYVLSQFWRTGDRAPSHWPSQGPWDQRSADTRAILKGEQGTRSDTRSSCHVLLDNHSLIFFTHSPLAMQGSFWSSGYGSRLPMPATTSCWCFSFVLANTRSGTPSETDDSMRPDYFQLLRWL